MNAQTMMKLLCGAVKDVCFPTGVFCLNCRSFSGNALLCAECAAAMEAMRLKTAEEEQITPIEGLRTVRAVWRYEGLPMRMVWMLKFQRVENAAEVLADGMTAMTAELDDLDAVTWIPMPKKRRMERGIDHGRALAEVVAERLRLPAVPMLRLKDENAGIQRGRNAVERRQRTGRFAADAAVADRRVLLVDDVLTTGSTVRDAAGALMRGGCASVDTVCATRTILKGWDTDDEAMDQPVHGALAAAGLWADER